MLKREHAWARPYLVYPDLPEDDEDLTYEETEECHSLQMQQWMNKRRAQAEREM